MKGRDCKPMQPQVAQMLETTYGASFATDLEETVSVNTVPCEITFNSTRRRARRHQRRAARQSMVSGITHACHDQTDPEQRVCVNDAATDNASHDAQLLQALETEGNPRLEALALLRGSVRRLCFESTGCRVIQQALKVGGKTYVTELVEELHGSVLEAASSPHANYVLQAVIAQVPTELVKFIIQEIKGKAVEVARHRYGCRILCRLLEHSPSNESSVHMLVDEILEDPVKMCRHTYAHHVMNSIMEHGIPEQRQIVAAAVKQDLLANACGRTASYVVEKILLYGSQCDREEVTAKLCNPENIVWLGQSECGGFVVRTMASMPATSFSKDVMGLVQAGAEQLAMTKYGKRLLQDLGLAWQEVEKQ